MPFYSWIRYIFVGSLLIVLSVACRSASPFSAGISVVRGEKGFAGEERESGIPFLKQRVGQPDFYREVAERPLFLGVHKDGRYAAVITVDPDDKALRLSVLMPENGKPAVSWSLPAASVGAGEGESEEELELILRMVVRGYGIRIPARPIPLVPGEEHELEFKKGWTIRLVRDHGHVAVRIRDKEGQEWSAGGSVPADRGHRHELLPLPGQKGKWLVAVTDVVGGLVNVYRLDLSKVALSAPDSRILGECRIRFRAPCRIAWRSWEGRGLVLAVSEEDRSVAADGLLFRGETGRFAVYSSEGKLLAAGGERGITEPGKSAFSERKRVERYRMDVLPGPDGASSVFLAADAFSAGGRLLRTMEWEWNREKGVFRRVGGGPG